LTAGVVGQVVEHRLDADVKSLIEAVVAHCEAALASDVESNVAMGQFGADHIRQRGMETDLSSKFFPEKYFSDIYCTRVRAKNTAIFVTKKSIAMS
jgi:hypothetical protein